MIATEPLLLATFRVHDALFALEASRVQEVIRLGPVTRVRHAPGEVVGIMNLRGRIVTVIDAALRLGFPAGRPGPDSRIFLLEDRDEFLGVLVDCAGQVVEVERDGLELTPSNVAAGQARFFVGVYRTDGRAITLLDADRLLAASG